MCSHVTTDYFVDARDARGGSQKWRSLSLSAQLFGQLFHTKNTDKKRFVLGTEYLEQKHTGLSSVDDAWHGLTCDRDMDARETGSTHALRCSTSTPEKSSFPTAEAIDLRASPPEIVLVQFIRRCCACSEAFPASQTNSAL